MVESKQSRLAMIEVANCLAFGVSGVVFGILGAVGIDTMPWTYVLLALLGFPGAWFSLRRNASGTLKVLVLDDRIEYEEPGKRTRVAYEQIASATYVLHFSSARGVSPSARLTFYSEGRESHLATMDMEAWRERPVGDWSRQLLRHLDEHQVSIDDSVRRLLGHELVQRSLRSASGVRPCRT